jgi:hypothetical protein
MRIRHTIMLAAVAAAGVFAQPAVDAEAGSRWHMQFGWPFAYPEYYAPRPRYYYYEPEYYDPYYGDEAYYDPYFYEPPPRRKRHVQRFYEDPDFYEPPPVRKKRPQVSTANPAPAKKTASGSVSCDKAKTIIGDYGFASITPIDCEGSEFGFKAQRGGKSFSIKVSSLSGELTEVKRQ